jgi:glycosyltransferase involved in cell wall biosynthesis
MNILIATDAWEPQVNGVVTTLLKIKELSDNVCFITPDNFKTYNNPFYPEIRIALPSVKNVENVIQQYNPDFIHIATEGPIGWAVRRWCIQNKIKFTTSYHTKFPEFIQSFFRVPTWMTYWFFRNFHNAGNGTFVATPSLAKDLGDRGFKNLIPWTRGVDTKQFHPNKTITEPYILYVGRVSVEKNIRAFLDIKTEFRKVVVGDGPELKALMKRYPDVEFVGKQKGSMLSYWYQNAEVFVFPSKNDTFGLVMLEALACGTPVAAYPVTGPIDIIHPGVGDVNEDLSIACIMARFANREVCRSYAERFDWFHVVKLFEQNIINKKAES